MQQQLAVAERLASALGRRDEAPNTELATEIVRTSDERAIDELADILQTGKTNARNDAIKVLYEIGDREPAMISRLLPTFLEHMHAGNNRLVWGSLTALACLCRSDPDRVAEHLGDILDAADAGSVIARDQAMAILVTLATNRRHTERVTPILIDRLRSAAVNQLPMYAERSLPVITGDAHIGKFRAVLEQRLAEAVPLSKRKRLEAALKKLAP